MIIEALKEYPDDSEMVVNACMAIMSLHTQVSNKKEFVAGGIKDIIRVATENTKLSDAARSSCQNLSRKFL